jgi:hypothetical protein
VRFRPLLALAALLTLGACSPAAMALAQAAREADYPVPIEQARRVLAAAESPPMVFGDSPVQFRLADEEATRLVWAVSKSGREVMRYTADLVPTGQGTRVTLNLQGAAKVEERLAKSESIRTLYLAAMRERIDADLEGRPYDLSNIYPALTTATVDNLELFEPPPDQSRQVMKQAYREELEGGRNY